MGRFRDLSRRLSSIILLRCGIADPSAKPPPFLGVSSLNLAALAFPKRPFFLTAIHFLKKAALIRRSRNSRSLVVPVRTAWLPRRVQIILPPAEKRARPTKRDRSG